MEGGEPMKTLEIDAGTYDLVLKMARIVNDTPEYVLYRSVWREYIAENIYHREEEGKGDV